MKKRTSRINWNVLNHVIENTKSLFANGDDVKIEMKEEDDDSLFTEHLNLNGDSFSGSQMNNNNNYNSQSRWNYDDEDDE